MFIYDNTTLPFPKIPLNPLPIGASPVNFNRTVDWNILCQALIDVQSFCRGANWLGASLQATDPAPAGVANYLYLGTDNKVHVKADVLRALVDETRQVKAGTGLTGGGALSTDR